MWPAWQPPRSGSALIELRESGKIGDAALQQVEQELGIKDLDLL